MYRDIDTELRFKLPFEFENIVHFLRLHRLQIDSIAERTGASSRKATNRTPETEVNRIHSTERCSAAYAAHIMIHYKLLVVHWSIFTLSVQLIYCASLHSSKYIHQIQFHSFDPKNLTIYSAHVMKPQRNSNVLQCFYGIIINEINSNMRRKERNKHRHSINSESKNTHTQHLLRMIQLFFRLLLYC